MNREEWADFADEECPADLSRVAIEAHLQSCSECRALKDATERGWQLLEESAALAYRDAYSDPDMRRISTTITTRILQSSPRDGTVPVAPAWKEGDLIEGYAIIRSLPAGGFGQPYLAYPCGGDQMKDRVVFKFLPAGTLEADLEDRGVYSVHSMLQRVVMSAGRGGVGGGGRRKSPASGAVPLLPCFGAGKTGRDIFVITEYCPGGSLKDLLNERDQGISVEAAGAYIRDVLRAVRVLHEHGLSHNDIKPGNIFLRDAGVVLGDYSLVSRIENIPRYGTPGYIAPERAAGVADHRADLYSVGMTFFELVTGLPPEYHMDLPIDLDAPVRRMIERAKKYDPSQRYPSASGMLEELDRYGLERKWWPPVGMSLEDARSLDDAFMRAMVPRLSGELVLANKKWKPIGAVNEGNRIDEVLSLAAELRAQAAVDRMPCDRWAMRAFQTGWRGERQVLVYGCLSPLAELLRDGASTKTMTHDDLCAAAQRIAKDDRSTYLIGLFAPCGWSEDCLPAEGLNWRVFPIDKLEGTRWCVNLGVSEPGLLAVFDPESRAEKMHRLREYARARPELHRPDGILTLAEIGKAQEITDETLVEEALRLLCREDRGLEIMDLTGFGWAIARRGLGS